MRDKQPHDQMVLLTLHTLPSTSPPLSDHSQEGIPYHHMAVLLRVVKSWFNTTEAFQQQMMRQGVPHTVVRGVGLRSAVEVQDVMAYCRWVGGG